MVHFKIVSMDGIIFGFALGTQDEIKLGIIESTDMGSLIGSSKRYGYDKLSGSLNIID